MSRTTVKEMMAHALEYKYSVGYFESWNLESSLAVVRAAENMKSPVIIGVCGTYIGEPKRKYKESLSVYQTMLAKIAEEASVPVALLLNESDDELHFFDSQFELFFNFIVRSISPRLSEKSLFYQTPLDRYPQGVYNTVASEVKTHE